MQFGYICKNMKTYSYEQLLSQIRKLYEKRTRIHTNISLLSGRIPGDEAGQDPLANNPSQIVYHVLYPKIILLSQLPRAIQRR